MVIKDEDPLLLIPPLRADSVSQRRRGPKLGAISGVGGGALADGGAGALQGAARAGARGCPSPGGEDRLNI